MKQALTIFAFLRACAARGEPAALITLTGVVGSSVRAPGSHMAVSMGGDFVGSFSAGCIEAAAIAEAQATIASGQPRTVRFGAGTPYIDIRLPCGGGVDLHILPNPPLQGCERVCTLLQKRQPVSLRLGREGDVCVLPSSPADATGWTKDMFLVRHYPLMRLVILGHGAEPAALMRLARAIDAETVLLSPDMSCIEAAQRLDCSAVHLRMIGRSNALVTDPYTAVAALFHDHAWETALLAQTLEQPAFCIGAMGSRKTHAERCRALAAAGASPTAISRIIGPVGLLPASRDPQTLAVSVLAQVVQAYDQLLAAKPPEPVTPRR